MVLLIGHMFDPELRYVLDEIKRYVVDDAPPPPPPPKLAPPPPPKLAPPPPPPAAAEVVAWLAAILRAEGKPPAPPKPGMP
jgi:hypothetical protein